MEFVFQFPMRAMNRWDDWIAGHSVGELAAAAEDSGFALISTTDHPFPEQKWLAGGGHHAFDPFVSLAFMAAQTSRIRLLTMLVVSGYRKPHITAMQAAWTGEVVELDDPYYPAHGHVMMPRPAQAGGPPLWFGGNSNRALRRGAEIG